MNATPQFKMLITMLLLLGIAVVLLGCNLEQTLGVQEDDNALLCISASTGGFGAFLSGEASGVRIELPSGTDTSAWTNEEWKTLLEACD